MLLLPGRAAEDCLDHVTALLSCAGSTQPAGLTSRWSGRQAGSLVPTSLSLSLPSSTIYSTPCVPHPPPRTLPTLCTSANGAAKVTARFLDGGQDRRRIGRIRFPSELEGVAHECCHTMTVAVTAYLALHSPTSLLKCCTNFYSTCWHNKEPKNMKQHFFKGALGSQIYLRRRPTVLFAARVNSQNI